MDFTDIFVFVDDFWKSFFETFNKHLLADGKYKRIRDNKLSMSEIMTILICFQTSGYRDFKNYYRYLCLYHRREFPGLVSYNRFVTLMPRATMPLFAFLHLVCMDTVTGISFMDSTSLKVCHNKRITRHKVFNGTAQRGKSTMGWFFGFKLHLVVNDQGGLLAYQLTPGNVDDRTPVKGMTRKIIGKLFADKGYISQSLFETLMERGLKLITGVRDNMKPKLMEMEDKILLRKRSIIETINDTLKNVCQVEHSRHRSPINFVVHLISGLIAYSQLPKKPSINLNWDVYDGKMCLA